MGITRREFLKTTLLTGSGLLLGCNSTSDKILSVADVEKASDKILGVWLRIDEDGGITFIVPSAEMGQGVLTSQTMIVAEELEVEFNQIKSIQAHASSDYDHPKMFMQLTGGSTSISGWWTPLQKMGATARTMLVHAAANRWQVNAEQCQVVDGMVIHKTSDKKLGYGELAADAARLKVPESPKLKSPKDYRYIGKPLPRKDGFIKVTGQAEFGIDVKLPGMLYATVRQSPVFGGRVNSFNKGSVKHINGFVDVVEIPNGVAVVAKSTWQAFKAAKALEIEFEGGNTQGIDNQSIYKLFSDELEKTGKVNLEGDKLLDVEYEVPYLAHATMEPMNCTADVRDESCTVWAPTQGQSTAHSKAAEIAGLDKEKVRINTTYMGGGFGRRSEADFVIQAVTVSKKLGKPVKVIWSREEDTQHDFYRPAYLSRMQVKLGEDGYPERWEHQLVGPSILAPMLERTMGLGMVASMLKWIDFDATSTEGAAELPYAIPDHSLDYTVVDPGVPVGFWRSVGSSHNAFTTESVIDEAAHLAGVDPYKYRSTLLKDQPRHKAVLDQVAKEANWGADLPAGHAQGISMHKSFDSFVAQVAEVSVEQGKLKVHKVHCVVDCGRYVNPNTIEAQMQGGIIMALSSIMNEEVRLKEGAVSNSNFHDYPILKMADSPEIHVSILESKEEPTGVGEPGVPPLMAAVTNAIYVATGKRIRKLPIADQLS